jgi:hypothetical protein
LVAASHYQLMLGNAAESDSANKASIGTLSGWLDFFTLETNKSGPSRLGWHK